MSLEKSYSAVKINLKVPWQRNIQIQIEKSHEQAFMTRFLFWVYLSKYIINYFNSNWSKFTFQLQLATNDATAITEH